MFSRQEMTKMEQMSPSHVIPHLSTAIRCSEYPAMVSDDHDASLTYESSTCGHAAEARQEHPAALMEVDVAFVDEVSPEAITDRCMSASANLRYYCGHNSHSQMCCCDVTTITCTPH